MIKHKLLLLLSLLLVVNASWAQTAKVTGKIVNRDGEPLLGASVTVGEQRGTTTDMNGDFSIEASATDLITIDYLGYETQEIVVGRQTHINITLLSANNMLDEVVVVGYGTQKKVNITGSVSTVDYSGIAKSRPIATTASALSGMNAGVMVRQTASNPGSEAVEIRIRGIGTLNTSAPLVIVDGFEGTISNVNPDDIESISVLKDAASCAIYGNRGANGVVLITTKSGGKQGKLSVSYSGQMAMNRPASHFKVVSNYADYMEISNEASENIGNSSIFSQSMIDLWREKENDPNGIADSGYPNYVAYPNTDWMEAIYKPGVYQKHNLSATGSVEGTSYLISMSYMYNPGVVDNTAYERYQLRANISSKINKWLELGTRIWGYEGERQINDFSGASSYLSRAVPGIFPYYDGKYGWLENPEQNANSRNNLYFFNRLGGRDKSLYVNAGIFANVKLPFGIKWNTSFNHIRQNNDYMKYVNAGGAYSFSRDQVAYSYNNLANLYTEVNNSNNSHTTLQSNMTWNKVLADKHDIGALFGFEMMSHNNHNALARKTGYSNADLHEFDTITNLTTISGTQSDYAAESFFGRLTYAYDSRYLLEVNMRYDGSSRFSSRSRWGLFPSVSAGWRISEEQFMKDSGIDNLKLRASWGRLGNNSIGNYDYQSTYASGLLYSFGNKLSSGIVSTLSNELLEWETTTSTDIGVDLALFKSRLTVEADLYSRVTDGILYKAPVFATVGNKAAPYQNLCQVTNQGYEITVGWQDRIGEFHYGISVNYTRNRNLVTKYNGALEAGWVTDENGYRTYQTNIGDVSTGTYQRVMEGKIINEWYLLNTYSGDGSHFFADGTVNPNGGPVDGMIRTEDDMQWLNQMIAGGATFLPNKKVDKKNIWYGDLIYADTNGDGIYGDTNDYTFQNKSLTPKFYYGLQFDMGWRGFDMSVALSGAGGNASYWRFGGYNSYGLRSDLAIPYRIGYDHYFYDPENPDDPRTNITSENGRLTMNLGSEQNGGANYSTKFYYDLDYLRVKNISIGYSFGAKLLKRIGIQGMRIYLSGENLFTFTDFPGMDPEFSSTTNYYAMLKQYTIGLNIQF